jgi:hypothetical protein
MRPGEEMQNIERRLDKAPMHTITDAANDAQNYPNQDQRVRSPFKHSAWLAFRLQQRGKTA